MSLLGGLLALWALLVGACLGVWLGIWLYPRYGRGMFHLRGGIFVPRQSIEKLWRGEVTVQEHLDLYQATVREHLEKHPFQP